MHLLNFLQRVRAHAVSGPVHSSKRVPKITALYKNHTVKTTGLMGIMELGYYALNFISAVFLRRYGANNSGGTVLHTWLAQKFIPPAKTRTLDLEEALSLLGAVGTGEFHPARYCEELEGGCSKTGPTAAHQPRPGVTRDLR